MPRHTFTPQRSMLGKDPESHPADQSAKKAPAPEATKAW